MSVAAFVYYLSLAILFVFTVISIVNFLFFLVHRITSITGSIITRMFWMSVLLLFVLCLITLNLCFACSDPMELETNNLAIPGPPPGLPF